MRLLIVDDDLETAETLKDELEDQYIVEVCLTGVQGEYQAQINQYDVIVLDYHLPDIDGLEVCKRIRESNIHTPILILTGESDLEKKIEVIDAGADDYLMKPFSIGELQARIRALMRRHPSLLHAHVISVGDLSLDPSQGVAKRGSKVIPLRRKELYVLEYLMRNAGRVITREMLLDHACDSGAESLTNTVDVHIKYLRDRIDRQFDKKLIKTVHGLGYKIEA